MKDVGSLQSISDQILCELQKKTRFAVDILMLGASPCMTVLEELLKTQGMIESQDSGLVNIFLLGARINITPSSYKSLNNPLIDRRGILSIRWYQEADTWLLRLQKEDGSKLLGFHAALPLAVFTRKSCGSQATAGG